MDLKFNIQIRSTYVRIFSLFLWVSIYIFLNYYPPVFKIKIQLLSCVQLFESPWTGARQVCLSFIISQFAKTHVHWIGHDIQPLHVLSSLLLLLSVFPSTRVFSNELALHIRRPKYWASASASILPVNIQGWSPLGLTCLISWLTKGLSRILSNTIIQKHQMCKFKVHNVMIPFYIAKYLWQ